MLTPQQHIPFNKILEELGVALDITESQYKLVEGRYTAVGNHLSKETSILKDYEIDIMPQGSFLLGTMIKPIMEDSELDVDIVCRLKRKHNNWAQVHLKQAVKEQIEDDDRYKQMLNKKEGKRCWRIDYSDDTKFHLDILPAIVNQEHYALLEKSYSNLTETEIEKLAIRITDNTKDNYDDDTNLQNWLSSNPFGYAAWFNERKKTTDIFKGILNESIKPLPKFSNNKEPLQRVVQILKRHRDIMFGSDEDKPISIIITTLAARAYNGEINIENALLNILANMNTYIKYEWCNIHNKTIARIENPVNSKENFADKWPLNPNKEQNFNMWLAKAQDDFGVLKTKDHTQIYRTFKSVIGSKAVNEGFRNAGATNLINESYLPSNNASNLLSVAHRQQPTWPLKLIYEVEVHGHFKQGKMSKTITSSTLIPKYCDIFFVATSNVPKPFDVYWQVVNTGTEAEKSGGLRGGIIHSKTFGIGGLNQKERSEYKGIHWIECFIVKDGVCVARSAEFFVNID